MVFCLCFIFCVVELIQAKTIPLVGKELKFALDYHNEMRRREKGANMMKLKWSNTLAREALAWAKRCAFKHQMKSRGENLAYSTIQGSLHEHIKSAMDRWYAEKKLHSWSAFRCSSSCHYTQIVWAKTKEVGCAMEKCAYLQNSGARNAWYYVCFYHPRGNWEKVVYMRGAPCSKCPKGGTCDKGLCVGGRSVDADASGKGGICMDKYGEKKCKNWAKWKQCSKNPKFMKVQCKKSCKVCK